MNDIQVGDRVHPDGYGDNVTQGVVAIEGNEAWLVDFMGVHRTHRLSDLTRIEPEKVALTPKYKMGQEVESPAGKRTIREVFVAYRMRSYGGWWTEDQLKAVPEPCPECKGSGVANE